MASITVIDDDVELADNVAALLRRYEHKVSTLSDTAGAQEALSQNMPDLLILDVMFPDNATAGFDLARELRRSPETRSLPIILLTGVNQEFPLDFSATDIDSTWMPVQDFVEKPFDIDVLAKKVADLLGQDGK